MNLSKKIKFFFEGLENSSYPLFYFLLTFFFAINIRYLLEALSSGCTNKYQEIEFLIHSNLFYVAVAMSLILLFAIATKENVARVFKVVLPFFAIATIPPLLDLIISGGRGYAMSYLLPGVHANLFERFFFFFGNLEIFPGTNVSIGVTPGIRIEIALLLIVSFLYLYVKKKKIVPSLFWTFLAYGILFFYGSLPFFLKTFIPFSRFSPLDNHAQMTVIHFYLSVVFLLGLALAYLASPSYFKIILKDIRALRILHYLMMFALGTIIATKIYYGPVGLFLLDNATKLIFTTVSIILACLYSLMTNNMVDQEIDRISNPKRPLVSDKITPATYGKISWVVLFLSLVYAYAADIKTFIFVLAFIAVYFLFSMPPLRLKRITFFSKTLIAFNSLMLVLLGYNLLSYNMISFPKVIYPFFLIGLTPVFNFIDIKDYEGDKAAGIKTLPVVLGLKRSKIIIGIFFFLAYFWLYLIYKDVNFAVSFIILGAVQFFIINRKNYQEKPVFWTYIITAMVFLYIFFTASP